MIITEATVPEPVTYSPKEEVNVKIESLTHPFIEWANEDKSGYPSATSKGFIDETNDFLVGESGGFLMNMDFIFKNIHLFTAVGRYYEQHNKYEGDSHLVDSPAYNSFWKRETRRRREGMVARCKLRKCNMEKYNNARGERERDSLLEDLHITGDHYNFLNYTRINRTPNREETLILKRQGLVELKEKEGFPRFWDSHWWYHKIKRFSRLNGFNNAVGKSRRKGYTYVESAGSANALNLIPVINITHLAYDDDYLLLSGKLTSNTKNNLDFYNGHTYWNRGGYVVDKGTEGNYKLGWFEEKTSTISGWKSSLESFAFMRNTSKAIGSKGFEVKIDESGKAPNLLSVVEGIFSNTESGAIKIGPITLFGTGGVEAADWTPFSTIHGNPSGYGCMPFENVYDKDSRHRTCGYFHPNIWSYEDLEGKTIDEDGNSNLELSLELDYAAKKTKEQGSNPEDYVIFISQRANSPDEAFGSGRENRFTSPELILHVNRLKYDKDLHYHKDGIFMLEKGRSTFKLNEEVKNLGLAIHPYINKVPIDKRSDHRGCWRMWHDRILIDGRVPDGVFAIEYDPVGSNVHKDDFTAKHSLASIRVKIVPNPHTKFRVLNRRGITAAVWTGRGNTMEEDDRELYLACSYYNAKALVEVNRGETKSNFAKWKALGLLTRFNYNAVMGDLSINPRHESIGIVIDTKKRRDGLDYLYNELYEIVGLNSEGGNIYAFELETELEFLLELLQYDPEKNFDRISRSLVGTFDSKAIDTQRNNNTTDTKTSSEFNNRRMTRFRK